jgi:hypothetical protein
MEQHQGERKKNNMGSTEGAIRICMFSITCITTLCLLKKRISSKPMKKSFNTVKNCGSALPER